MSDASGKLENLLNSGKSFAKSYADGGIAAYGGTLVPLGLGTPYFQEKRLASDQNPKTKTLGYYTGLAAGLGTYIASGALLGPMAPLYYTLGLAALPLAYSYGKGIACGAAAQMDLVSTSLERGLGHTANKALYSDQDKWRGISYAVRKIAKIAGYTTGVVGLFAASLVTLGVVGTGLSIFAAYGLGELREQWKKPEQTAQPDQEQPHHNQQLPPQLPSGNSLQNNTPDPHH